MLFKEDRRARRDAETIRKSVGWYMWTHDLVEVTGPDALALLQKLFVSDLSKVPAGRTKYTAMLNEDGEILDDVIVMHMRDGVYWVSSLYGPRFIDWAGAHADGQDVQIRLITYEHDMIAVQGPETPAAMERLVGDAASGMKRFAVREAKIGDAPVWLHRSGFTGENGFEIYCAPEQTPQVKEAVSAAVEAAGGQQIYTLEVYVRSVPMEKGFALKQDYKHMSPFECGLGWTVSEEKDFIGKEAALKIKESPRFQMVGLEFERESTEDISIWEKVYLYGVEVGRCAQAIYGYTVDKNIGFANIRAGIPEGTRVTVGPNGSPAVVVSKVFC